MIVLCARILHLCQYCLLYIIIYQMNAIYRIVRDSISIGGRWFVFAILLNRWFLVWRFVVVIDERRIIEAHAIEFVSGCFVVSPNAFGV